MIDRLLTIVAPHPCYKCGKMGSVLCGKCKYDISLDMPDTCLLCGKPTSRRGICQNENTAYSKAWYVGSRADTVKRLIDAFKFENVYEAHRSLADLLSDVTLDLPQTVTVVPLPTVPAHVRQRGYDHTSLLARALAKRKNLPFRPLLQRKTNSIQRNASRSDRFKQAKQAFKASQQLNGGTYLVVDDIATTGASLEYASRTLLAAGADEAWVAVIARQPLD